MPSVTLFLTCNLICPRYHIIPIYVINPFIYPYLHFLTNLSYPSYVLFILFALFLFILGLIYFTYFICSTRTLVILIESHSSPFFTRHLSRYTTLNVFILFYFILFVAQKHKRFLSRKSLTFFTPSSVSHNADTFFSYLQYTNKR